MKRPASVSHRRKLPKLSYTVVNDVIRYSLIPCVLTKDYRVVRDGCQDDGVEQGSYEYFIDGFSQRIFLSNLVELKKIYPCFLAFYDVVAAGRILLGDQGFIRIIDNQSSLSPYGSLTLLFSLESSSQEKGSVVQNMSDISARFYRLREEPFLFKRHKKHLMRASAYQFFGKFQKKHKAERRVLLALRDANFSQIDEESFDRLPTKVFVDVFYYASQLGSKTALFLLNDSLVERLSREDISASGALKHPAVSAIVQDFQKKFHVLSDLEIEVLEISLHEDWSVHFSKIAENSRKAFLVSIGKNLHKGLVYVDKASKSLYFSDSVGLQSLQSLQIYQSLQGEDYDVYTHSSARQSDHHSCVFYCLKDLEKLHGRDLFKKIRDAYKEAGLDPSDTSTVPADLLGYTQSTMKIELHDQIRLLCEKSSQESSAPEEWLENFQRFLNVQEQKHHLDRRHWDFLRPYEETVQYASRSPLYFKIYFYRENDAGRLESPLRFARFFEKNLQNNYINQFRAVFLSRFVLLRDQEMKSEM